MSLNPLNAINVVLLIRLTKVLESSLLIIRQMDLPIPNPGIFYYLKSRQESVWGCRQSPINSKGNSTAHWQGLHPEERRESAQHCARYAGILLERSRQHAGRVSYRKLGSNLILSNGHNLRCYGPSLNWLD